MNVAIKMTRELSRSAPAELLKSLTFLLRKFIVN